MKIGIDIDDVVVEYMRSFLEFYNKTKNTNYSFEQVVNADLRNSGWLSKEELIEVIEKFRVTDAFANLDVLPGAVEGILELDRNNEIFFITSRHISTKKTTTSLFEMIFPGKNFEIFFSGENWGSGKTKGEICLDLGVEVMLEDRVEYASDCAGKGVKAILLSRPWNADYPKNEKITRVADWAELIKLLEEEIYAN